MNYPLNPPDPHDFNSNNLLLYILHADYADYTDFFISHRRVFYNLPQKVQKSQKLLGLLRREPTVAANGEKQIEHNLNQIKQIIILQDLNKICRISRQRRLKRKRCDYIISVISVISV